MSTARSSGDGLPALAECIRWLKAAPLGALLELASRLGYVARGLVYFCLGTIALLAALDFTPRARGAAEAVAAWADWPFGQVLIMAVASGLLAFAAWRGMQSLFDADGHGGSAKGLAVRAGQALSGLVHVGLALSILEVADGLGDVEEEHGAAEAFAESLLGVPYGDMMVTGVGAAIFALGLANLGQAFFQDFRKRLGCDEATCRWAVSLARTGYIGRTLAFTPLGFFLILAGRKASSSEALSLGESLQVLESQPFGSAVLGATGLGLIAFGVFAIIEARFRRIHPQEVIDR